MKCSKRKSKSSMVKVHISFQMSLSKRDLGWPSTILVCILMTISSLIFSGTGCNCSHIFLPSFTYWALLYPLSPPFFFFLFLFPLLPLCLSLSSFPLFFFSCLSFFLPPNPFFSFFSLFFALLCVRVYLHIYILCACVFGHSFPVWWQQCDPCVSANDNVKYIQIKYYVCVLQGKKLNEINLKFIRIHVYGYTELMFASNLFFRDTKPKYTSKLWKNNGGDGQRWPLIPFLRVFLLFVSP